MDICKLLKNINGVNQYISITKDSLETCKNSRIPLNMTTILSLNKIRALEVEYFNKCEDNGIACTILERMLSLPPSKTWGVLGKELVFLLQYWLQALLRHLNNKFRYWWKFLKLLLTYLREIRVKDSTLPNMLVEHTAECLLELATREQFDAMQQQEILYCLNMFCSESSREIRFALRNKFSSHFVKLALRMAECGYLPCQYSVLETLLRWLLPRQQPSLRQAEAEKWFPKGFYSRQVADIFVERPWKNFFRDARDLLNTHNDAGELIASVLCRSLTVGQLVILSGDQGHEAWLDINIPTKCITVLLDPRLLESVGVANHRTFETLLISDDNTRTARLYRQEKELTISVSTHQSPQILPASIQLVDGGGDVTIAVTSRSRLSRLDSALRRVFGDKYQVLLDVEEDIQGESSPSKEIEYLTSSQKHDDPRFSHPAELKTRPRSGYMVRQGPRSGCKSPSTASTSSLAQLREKLSALPRFRYDKTLDSVCALPDLSVVTEHTEKDTNSSFISILRRPHGVITRNKRPFKPVNSPLRKSQSDNESYQRSNRARQLSPVYSDNDPSSSLLAATLNRNDESVINDTVEELAKINIVPDDGIVDLLAKEFMQAEAQKKGDILDSGIGIDEKKNGNCSDNIDAIENTPFADDPKSMKQQYKLKKVSSTDESNTDQNETPSCVNTRSKYRVKDNKLVAKVKPKIDEKTVESFFSQHFAEKKAGEIAVSPTLAKKINETSSEGDDLDQNYFLANENLNEYDIHAFNEVDVIECLNSMVDKICDEFNRCSEYLNIEQNIDVLHNNTDQSASEKTPIQNTIKPSKRKDQKKKNIASKADPKIKHVKLTYKISSKVNTRSMKQKNNKLQIDLPAKMSTIIEDNNNDDATENEPETLKELSTNDIIKNTELNVEKTDSTRTKNIKDLKEKQSKVDNTKADVKVTPNVKRKRKLYSPKDEQVDKKCALRVPETEDDDDMALSEFKRKKELKTKATCYKEIERERKRYVRAPRTRRSRNKSETASPRTKKFNDMFDKLKETVEGEKVKIADKTFEVDVYNFTSDSEDEDFKKKTIEVRKNNSITQSVESTLSERGRVIKRAKGSRTNLLDENKNTQRKVTKRKIATPKVSLDSVKDLVDERMRESKDVLNTSIIIEKARPDVNEPELALDAAPAMEIIADKVYETRKAHQKKKNIKKTPKSTDIKKSHKKTPSVKTVLDDDRTVSPLPGLVVETAPSNRYDPDISASMVDKFKKIYRDGPESFVNESNTTHNLLSDVERNNFSSQNIDLITEDIMELEEAMESRILEHEKLCHNKQTPSTKSLRQEKNKAVRKSNNIEHLKSRSYLSSDNNANKLSQKFQRDIQRMSLKRYDSYNEDIETDGKGKHLSLNNKTKKSTQVSNSKNTRNTPTNKIQVTSLKGTNGKSESNIEIINVIESSKEETDQHSDKNTERSTNITNSGERRKKADVTTKSKLDIDSIEVINISNGQEDIYPKSIASAGITGHGESEESPPTPRLIDEDIQPRNVGLEDLDLSVKEYFDKLTREINESTKSNRSNSKRNEIMSPVMSVARVSLEDISKWLPSRRESSATDVSTVKLNEDGNCKSARNSRSVEGDNCKKTPKPSVEGILPNDSRKSLKLTFNRKYEVKLKACIENSDASPKVKTKENNLTTPQSNGRPKRLSLISPIKLFDDLISECDKKSEKTLSDDENYMKDIREMFSKKKVLKSLRNRNVSELKSKSPSTSSEDSRISTSTKIDNVRQCLKRKSVQEKEVKRKRVEVNNLESCESMRTLSSVSDWLKRNEPTGSTREAVSASIKDTVHNVLEKLDTTLVEIHQNTSRKFVHLFVESQRHLSSLKEQRVEMRKEAAGLLDDFKNIIDKKFADWDKMSQEREEDFMKQLKDRAYEIIRDDCKHKGVMVRLLREDVQAVLDHLNTHK